MNRKLLVDLSVNEVARDMFVSLLVDACDAGGGLDSKDDVIEAWRTKDEKKSPASFEDAVEAWFYVVSETRKPEDDFFEFANAIGVGRDDEEGVVEFLTDYYPEAIAVWSEESDGEKEWFFWALPDGED